MTARRRFSIDELRTIFGEPGRKRRKKVLTGVLISSPVRLTMN
jgi:hypothetical protein